MSSKSLRTMRVLARMLAARARFMSVSSRPRAITWSAIGCSSRALASVVRIASCISRLLSWLRKSDLRSPLLRASPRPFILCRIGVSCVAACYRLLAVSCQKLVATSWQLCLLLTSFRLFLGFGLVIGFFGQNLGVGVRLRSFDLALGGHIVYVDTGS